METRGTAPGFAPVHGKRAKALILGSYPSPKSFAYGFYYGHPQNRFWPLLARLAGGPTPESIDEKRRLILQNGLALWDVLERCTITGASDTSISNPVPNPIGPLVKQLGVQAVFCNGAAAHKFYNRFCLAETGLAATKLPSTSPANAAFSLERLAGEWGALAPYFAQE